MFDKQLLLEVARRAMFERDPTDLGDKAGWLKDPFSLDSLVTFIKVCQGESHKLQPRLQAASVGLVVAA